MVAVLLLFCCVVCTRSIGDDAEISDFLNQFSEVQCLGSTGLEDNILIWKQSFAKLLQNKQHSSSSSIELSESLLCDVIHTSSILISNTLKNYFFSGRGHTMRASDIPRQACPWSTALLDVLCIEFNDLVRKTLSKPVCKNFLSPIEYAVKLYNVNAVHTLLRYVPSPNMCQLGDCNLLFNIAAVKQDSELMEFIVNNLPYTDHTLCSTYSTMYYVCALGLGCEPIELIKHYLLTNCTLDEPSLVISKLMSQQSINNVAVNIEISSSGGWYRSNDNVDGICQIPVINIDRLTEDDFRSLEQRSVPVLIKGGLRDSVLFDEWNKSTLQSKYGHLEVLGGPIPYGDIFGELSGVSTINEFVQYMSEFDKNHHPVNGGALPLYIFDSQIIPDYFSHLVTLPDKLHIWNATLIHQFILGPKGSGSPFHFHCSAINTLVYGRKEWYLYPPSKGYYSKIHPLQWTHDGKELKCVQYSGDIVYVPSGWSHSTINIDDCIGHAIEFDTSDC